MWHLLMAAAVAGSTGFAAKHFLKLRPFDTQPLLPPVPDPQQTPPCNAVPTTLVENANFTVPENSHQTVIESNADTQNSVFTFTSSKSLTQDGSPSGPKKKPVMRRRGSKTGIRVAKVELRSVAEAPPEHRNGGKKFRSCFKTRKTNSIARKTAFCSPKDSSLFGWGVSFGITCMMAGKAEISELNKTMNETAKVIEELKSELNRRKSLGAPARQILDSVGNIGMESCKMNGRNDETMVKKTKSELSDSGVKILSLPVNDEGGCGSSALTEEPDQRVLEMDQLEAELEFEIQKFPGYSIDTNCHEEIRPKLDEVKVPKEGCHETDDCNFNSSQHHGILASELNQKLSQLLIEQQENQIADLESELNQSQSKLQEKEAELQALKDCVRRLTELPLSTVSDDETEARKGTGDWDCNTMDSESKQSVVGVKRPIDSESCAY